MKKHILLFAATLLLFPAFAQKTDRKLLTGSWNFRYFSVGDYTIDADNIKQTAAQRVKAAMAEAKDHLLSEKDSVALVEKAYKESAQIDSSSVRFNADGTIEVVLFLPVDGGSSEEPNQDAGKVQKGTYKWNGNNQLDVTLGEDLKVFTIRKLTANALELLVTEVGDTEGITIKLKK